MSKVQNGNKTHDDAVTTAEGLRQTAAAGATQAATKTADIAAYRAMLASALANNCGATTFITALRELGTGGV